MSDQDIEIIMDDLTVGELDPRTWYSFTQLEIGLLHNHIQELEKQINESVVAYQKEKVVTDVVDDGDGYSLAILEEHRGIEAPPDHLEEIYEYYFPNLQRRGTLFILFSFLEHQLDSLSELFARTQGLNILHTDLKDRGIDRSRRYLRKVIRLQLDDNSTDWHEIKKVQKVRNVLVHENGRLIDDAAIKIVNESDYLSRVNESNYERAIDEVNILEGYLPYVLDTFGSYCREVNEAIEAWFIAKGT